MKDVKPAGSGFNHLKILALFLTFCGAALFVYFISQAGLEEIWTQIERVGFRGFIIVFLIYATRLGIRSFAWSLSVEEPYRLKFKDSYQAVIIGEAMSSIIPLGIIISGTTKALAVRNKLPLVAGLSSLAIENLFYSFVTGLLLSLGAIVLLLNFSLPEFWYLVSYLLICTVLVLMIVGIIMIARQWHFASATAEWVYQKGFLRKWLETGRSDVKVFENRIYGFYRRKPQRFLPIFSLQVLFHLLGILEVWLILAFIGEIFPNVLSAFLLESVERGIVVIFKLVPLAIGVSEAASQFITDTLKLGAVIGVTLPIVRKSVRLSWAILGILLLVNRGFSIRDIFHHSKSLHKEDENLSHQTN